MQYLLGIHNSQQKKWITWKKNFEKKYFCSKIFSIFFRFFRFFLKKYFSEIFPKTRKNNFLRFFQKKYFLIFFWDFSKTFPPYFLIQTKNIGCALSLRPGHAPRAKSSKAGADHWWSWSSLHKLGRDDAGWLHLRRSEATLRCCWLAAIGPNWLET